MVRALLGSKLRLAGLAAVFALLSPLARAQLGLPAEINLFGDEMVRKLGEQNGVRFVGKEDAEPAAKKVEGYGHALVLQSRQQLRGELVSLTRDEVLWRRSDASEPLRFSRDEVQRIELAPRRGNGRSDTGPATVKLSGGDWLYGHVVSSDGQAFTVRLPKETSFNVARGQVEWLHFGPLPAPAFGFSGSALDLEGWRSRAAGSRLEVEGGTLTVRETEWLGREMSPPPRFEVAFELPEDAEEGTRLWLQPFAPQPNCYGTGTVQITCGRERLRHIIYHHKFEHKETALAKKAAPGDGPVRYRVFYDGTGRRLIVLRNGMQIGDWEFEPEKKRAEVATNLIRGICFDRESSDERTPLKLNRLRVQPWDGVIPADGQPAPGGDRLSLGKLGAVPGKLESVTEKEIIFSGQKKARNEPMFVQVQDAQSGLAQAEAMLNFGQNGEFKVADLEVREGRLRGRAVFAPSLEIGIGGLEFISFQRKAAPEAAAAQLLVFKNGDELRGSLLRAELGKPLRWKTIRGQTVEFQAERVAGVRLGGTAKAEPAATVELRNGDRVRGEFVGLEAKSLRLKHAQLGELALERERVWSCFPSASLAVQDGGCAPEAWLKGEVPALRRAAADSWIYLDGTYFLRPEIAGYSGQTQQIYATNAGALDRFELRCDATNAEGEEPTFTLNLDGKGGRGSVRATFSSNELSLYVHTGKPQQRPNWVNCPLRERVTEATSRMNVRVFVDALAGTADIFVDGMAVGKVGQHKDDRIPGLGAEVQFGCDPRGEYPTVLSQLWIGPWSGELPRAGGVAGAATVLANGDSAPGTPQDFREGKFFVETEIGPLELPVEKVQALEFGGTWVAEKAAGRVRLADGTVLQVDAFRWEAGELLAHSATVGDLRLPASAVSELIYDPEPVRGPRATAPKKLAQKKDPELPGAAEAN